VANSQWINWAYMKSKYDHIFDSSLHGQTPGRYFGFKKIGIMKSLHNSMLLCTLRRMATQGNFIG
jgi:hypothetical protein